MSLLVYLNGHLLPASHARISPLDYGFMYGYSLFETLRSYEGRLFRLKEHLFRLRKGSQSLGFPTVPENEEIEKAIRQVLQGNNLKDARIRLTLSLGEGSLSPDPSSCKQPVLVVAASHFFPPGEDIFEKGYKAIVSEHRRDSTSMLSRIKSGNYLASMLAREEARQKGVDLAVLLNERGMLSECQMANIFLVKNSRLITPDANSGILPGITRSEVLGLGAKLGLILEEREVRLEELYQSEEAFITNSLLEIMPLTSVNGRQIGKGTCGEVTRKLHRAYQEMAQTESY